MENQTRELQRMLAEMLACVDRICRTHDISYMLFAGTALGAVRHGGFIPWDDDLDIIMLRPDYERFLAVAEGELDADTYYLQREFSRHWPMFFSKLRRNRTACLERYVPKDPETHQGIYIDIFPCDNLSDCRMVRRLQFMASKVVIAKGLDKRGYLTDSRRKKAFMYACRLLPGAPFRRLTQLRGASGSQMVHCFLGAASRYEKSVFPRAWFLSTVDVDFEGGKYPVSASVDALLTALYGDYMTPTPEEERPIKQHAELVSLTRSWTEYEGWQAERNFDTHTRSIR